MTRGVLAVCIFFSVLTGCGPWRAMGGYEAAMAGRGEGLGSGLTSKICTARADSGRCIRKEDRSTVEIRDNARERQRFDDYTRRDPSRGSDILGRP